jgi:hypothetical protein
MTKWPRSSQLDRIERKIDLVLLGERVIMADEAALDQALADLGTHLDDLQVAAQSIVDKVSALPNAPDLSDEIATLQGFGSRLQETTDAITTAVAPPADTAPPPAEVPPDATAPAEPLPPEEPPMPDTEPV